MSVCHIDGQRSAWRPVQLRASLAVSLVVTLLGCAQHADAAPPASPTTHPVPTLTGWVNDTADVLNAADRQRLSGLLANYHRETHHQIVVLTIPTLAGETLETYSLRVANTWALGYKGLDNGILVLLAMKERKVRIGLGKGMERFISDAQAGSIIEESMVPAFRKGDFAAGLESGLERLMTEARKYVVTSSDLPGG